jgi:acetyl esterase/lipase
MVGVSYRGYWTSKGRPSEAGLLKDAAAALNWVSDRSDKAPDACAEGVPVILWGQSIGAGVATSIASRPYLFPESIQLKMLMLETPFTSVKDMLVTLYPQRWLPYKYLWPFLWNHLDSLNALECISIQVNRHTPKVVIVEAGKDELVPKSHGPLLEKRCIELGLDVQRFVVPGSLHTEVMTRPSGRAVLSRMIKSVGS